VDGKIKIEPSITYKNKDMKVVLNKKDGGSIWVEKTWTW
jgi:hypothetical protein